jgi:hypothetical protein
MRRGRSALILAALALVACGQAALAQQPASGASHAVPRPANGCVDCHSRLGEQSGAGHGFVAWRQSGHAAAGVGCDACHGGDPAAAEQATAHRGVVASGDPVSSVYFTRIPDTCGRCHVAEAGYFRSSVHYTRLKGDGRGPNCLTCHGSMATSVPTAEHVLGTCSACHVDGGVAPAADARDAGRILALLRSESVLLEVVRAQRAPGRETAGAVSARSLLGEADRQLGAAAEVWHGFRLDSTVVRLDAARRTVEAAWVALGHPAPREAPSFRGPGRR